MFGDIAKFLPLAESLIRLLTELIASNKENTHETRRLANLMENESQKKV